MNRLSSAWVLGELGIGTGCRIVHELGALDSTNWGIVRKWRGCELVRVREQYAGAEPRNSMNRGNFEWPK